MAKKFAVNTPIAKNILDRIGELPSKEELKKIQEEKTHQEPVDKPGEKKSESAVSQTRKEEPVAEIKTSQEVKEVKPLQVFDKETSSQPAERIRKTEQPVKETRPVGRPKGKNTKAKTFGLSFKYQDTLLALVIREKRKGKIEFSQRFAMEEALDLLFAKHGIDFADAREILEREAELRGGN
jgi:hypothetical protein